MERHNKEIVFDIGANHGWETEDAAICAYHSKRPWVDNYKVICVEPTPSLCDELKQKFKHSDVVVVQAAVTDEEADTVNFFLSPLDTLSTCSEERVRDTEGVHANGYKEVKKIEVPVIRIDKLVELYGKPSFIKIDVEGLEYKVLKTFAENYCPISFEWNEQELENFQKSMEECKKLGYTKFWVTYGNIGICEEPKAFIEKMLACPYWSTQLRWMKEGKVLVCKPMSEKRIKKYIENYCRHERIYKNRRTDPLWGQIYAE